MHAVEHQRRRSAPATPAAQARACSAATARGCASTAATTELRPRLAEILALLCAHPHGYSADALCADLHGDGGSPGSVRVEVSRLRKLLGPWIDTERYRLTCDVETDVRHVEGLLAAGRVREAAERYPGPLLPGSEAPGVVRERERLDALAAPGGHDLRRPGGAVGVGPDADRRGRPPRLEAAARRGCSSTIRAAPRCAARVGELRRAAATPM